MMLPPHGNILVYHHICRHFYPSITRVVPAAFQKQLLWLIEEGYRILNLEQYLFQADQSNSRIVCFTFDDSFSCLLGHALPLLHETGSSATIFVITSFVGKNGHWDYYKVAHSCSHLSWRHLREISDLGFDIGSHSHSHHDLKSMREERIRREMEYSKKLIEDKIGRNVHFFSYPFGRYDSRIKKICLETGYLGAVSMNPGNDSLDYYELPRSAVYLFDTLFQLKLKLGNGYLFRLERKKLRAINWFSLGSILLQNFQLNRKITCNSEKIFLK